MNKYDLTAIRPLEVGTPHHLCATRDGNIIRRNEDGSISISDANQDGWITLNKRDAYNLACWILLANGEELRDNKSGDAR